MAILASQRLQVDIGIAEEGRNVSELPSGDLVEYLFGFARVTFM